MSSHIHNSFRPIYCTASAYGIPDFGAKHPYIEQIKAAAEARHLSQPDVPARQVALVTKGAKGKGPMRYGMYQVFKEITGQELRWALHWALRIDDDYFELHRIKGTKNITFTARVWDTSRIGQITDTDSKYATTYMTNQEIVKIGLHYIGCWRLDYKALSNNCQKLLIAVSQDCLKVSSRDLSHAWIGYKAVQAGAIALTPLTHLTLALVGCPKEKRQEFDNALVDWGLSYLDISYSDRFGSFQNLRQDLRETSSPWATLFRGWRRRVIYNAHLNQAPLVLFPYVKDLGTDNPEVTNMQASSQKWKNRTLLPLLPLHAVLGTGFFLYDLAMVAASEPGAIKGAFDRRTQLNDTTGLHNYLKGDLAGLSSKIHLPNDKSSENSESKYELSKEAVLKFWRGESTWEEVVTVWKQRMEEEGISWDDVAQHLLTKRRQMAASAVNVLPDTLTEKEKAINRILNFTVWIFSLSPLFHVVMAGLIVL